MKEEFAYNRPEVNELLFKDFSEETMLETWKDYTKIIEDEGKFNLLSHLSMGIPKLDGTIIHLVFPNDTIKLEVERAKHELLNFLREKLQNHKISLSIEVDEMAIKRYAYTSLEKFEKLKEKNPLIDSLRKEFDLDI